VIFLINGTLSSLGPDGFVGIFVCHQQNVKLGAHVRISVGVREASEVIAQEQDAVAPRPERLKTACQARVQGPSQV
jgi:hypothetical protein